VPPPGRHDHGPQAGHARHFKPAGYTQVWYLPFPPTCADPEAHTRTTARQTQSLATDWASTALAIHRLVVASVPPPKKRLLLTQEDTPECPSRSVSCQYPADTVTSTGWVKARLVATRPFRNFHPPKNTFTTQPLARPCTPTDQAHFDARHSWAPRVFSIPQATQQKTLCQTVPQSQRGCT
jgi:hypothetical protein